MTAPLYFAARVELARPSAGADEKKIIEDARGDAKLAACLMASLLAVAYVVFFFGLGRLALIGPDEPRYAEVAREMMVTGDYVSPRLCGCLWFEKPVLLYWMSAAAYSLFGVGEFAARLPSALSSTVLMAFFFAALMRRYTAELSFFVSLALITSGITIGFARAASLDMVLTACMAISLLSGYIFAEARGRARFGWLAVCCAAMGLGVIAKGLVSLLLTCAILFFYLLATRRLGRLRARELAFGLALAVAVASIWYLPATLAHGRQFIQDFFIDHHFKRYISDKFNHPQPVYFYLFVALAGVMPWTFYLIPAVQRLRALKPAESRLDSLLLFAWIWVGVPLVFFSFSGSKLPGYLLPVFPALAIIIGVELQRSWRGERSRSLVAAERLTALLLVALVSAFLIYSSREEFDSGRGSVIPLAAPAALAALTLAAAVAKRGKIMIGGVIGTVAALVVGATLVLFQGLNETHTIKALSLHVARNLGPDERIAFFIYKEYAPVFYAEGRVVCGAGNRSILNAPDTSRLARVLQSDASLVVITTLNWLDELEADERFELEPLGFQRDVLAVRLRLKQ